MVTREFLEIINPTCFGQSPSFNCEKALEQAHVLTRLLQEIGLTVRIDRGVQDANHFAVVGFGCGAVRLSLFANLAVITGKEECPPRLVSQVSECIEKCGLTFVPWHFFGESFKMRNRFNGDLFNQLFDYQ